jgi:hypothetical protein
VAASFVAARSQRLNSQQGRVGPAQLQRCSRCGYRMLQTELVAYSQNPRKA